MGAPTKFRPALDAAVDARWLRQWVRTACRAAKIPLAALCDDEHDEIWLRNAMRSATNLHVDNARALVARVRAVCGHEPRFSAILKNPELRIYALRQWSRRRADIMVPAGEGAVAAAELAALLVEKLRLQRGREEEVQGILLPYFREYERQPKMQV